MNFRAKENKNKMALAPTRHYFALGGGGGGRAYHQINLSLSWWKGTASAHEQLVRKLASACNFTQQGKPPTPLLTGIIGAAASITGRKLRPKSPSR